LTTARLMLGALVLATDGVCGLAKSLLIDRSVPRVLHLVVEPEHRIGLGRLVPVELVCAVEEDADSGIDLDCDLARFEQLPLAETSELVRGIGTGYVYVHSPAPMIRVVHDSLPQDETPLRPGTPVLATDGEIGKVAGFVTEQPEHRIVQVLVDEARFPWGHRTVALPISCVVGLDSAVEVNLTVGEAAKVASAQRG
jgi:hypothetical protein